MLTRRTLLAACLASTLGAPTSVHAAEVVYDVRYFQWTADVAEALDQLAAVEEALASTSHGTLEIVKRGRDFGVICRAGAPLELARRTAAEHSEVLRGVEDTEEELAHALPRGDYTRVYNVSYGLGPNLRELVAHFDIVVARLGAGVARSLVIEKTTKGNYALVYKRYGDLVGTRAAAARHDELLRRSGVRASIIQEQAFRIVYDGATIFSEPPPEPPRPERPPPDPDAPPVREPLDLVIAPVPPPTDLDIPIEAPENMDEVPDVLPDDVPDEPSAPTDDAVADVDLPLEPLERGPATPIAQTSGPLTRAIEEVVAAERKARRLASDERTAWLVIDLDRHTTLAAIDADTPMQAASMIKPLVMLAFFHEVARGRFSYGSVSRGKLEEMIQRSSNPATNWVIDRVGGPAAVQKVLDQHYGELTRDTKVVERIAANGCTYRNLASAADYGRYLEAVWFGRVPMAKEQLRLLNLPGRDRIYNGAPNVPPGTAVYNKTGSTARCCGDMGILVARTTEGKPVPYVIVGIIDKPTRADAYSTWISQRSNVIRSVSDRVYLAMKGTHGLA